MQWQSNDTDWWCVHLLHAEKNKNNKKKTRGDSEHTRLSEPEPETSQNQSEPQKDIQVFSQVKSRLMELLRDSFMSLSNYILLNEEH